MSFNILHIFVHARPQNQSLEDCPNVRSSYKQPRSNQQSCECRAYPTNRRTSQDCTDLDRSSHECDVGEDGRPPLHGKVRLPTDEDDTNGREREEPESEKPEEDTGWHANGFPDVSNGDSGYTKEVRGDDFGSLIGKCYKRVGSIG